MISELELSEAELNCDYVIIDLDASLQKEKQNQIFSLSMLGIGGLEGGNYLLHFSSMEQPFYVM